MNMHKSDGISKKSFKKHNLTKKDEVIIEKKSDDVEMVKANKGRKISGIRKFGVEIVNYASKLEDEKDLRSDVKKNISEEVVEEDEDIIFDIEGDKNELEERFEFENEKKWEEKEDVIIDNEMEKDGNKVKLEKEKKHQKISEKERKELRKEKRNEILKGIESFEKNEKNLKNKDSNSGEEISEIIEEWDETLDKEVTEEKVISINNEKHKDRKILKVNGGSGENEKKNNEKLDDENKEKNLDTKKDDILEKDEDGLIVKESSELDKVKIDKNKLNSNNHFFTNKKQDEPENVIAINDNDYSKNLLLMIVGIIVLISILIGGLVFYKQIKSKKQAENSEIHTEKVGEKNIKDESSEDKKIEENAKKKEENNEVGDKVKIKKLFSDCSYFSNNLSSCTPYSCKYEHPDTHEIMKREVSGVKDGKCEYSETLVDEKILTCNYDKESQKLVTEFYDKILTAKFIGQAEINEEKVKGIENPIKKMVEEGICTVTKNTEISVGDCPEGKEYKGEYSNDGILLMPLCIDSNLICETCVDCISDKQKIIIDRIKGIGTCKDCSISEDCKEGYHCFNNFCVTNEILLNEVACSDENANCTKLPCKNCTDGNKYCNDGEKTWGEDLAKKCVDCTDTKYCKEGFKCKNYKCVDN